jgi:hypothetical protein
MKNIHILPTDKPSRLYKQTGVLLLDTISDTSKDGISINQHIYITSDEEIKVGGWVIEFQKGDNIGEVHFVNSEYVIASDIQKKIILTTDQDLIKDGVQAIDDEFLEWFVKNHNSEDVEVIKVCSTGRKCDGKGKNCNMAKLKIIIPKEEQKQDYSGVHLRHCYQGEYEDGCKYGEDDCPAKPLEKPKKLTDLEIAIKLEEIEREEFQQETLEEEVEKYSREVWGVYYDDVHPDIAITQTQGEISVKDFSRGAKWQAKRMYSEEEVYHILCEHTAFLFMGGKSTLSEWFEKYKKK